MCKELLAQVAQPQRGAFGRGGRRPVAADIPSRRSLVAECEVEEDAQPVGAICAATMEQTAVVERGVSSIEASYPR